MDWHPLYLRNLVTFQTSNNYQFRSISNGNLWSSETCYGIIQAHFQYYGATLWNCLPVTVRTSKTIIFFSSFICKISFYQNAALRHNNVKNILVLLDFTSCVTEFS